MSYPQGDPECLQLATVQWQDVFVDRLVSGQEGVDSGGEEGAEEAAGRGRVSQFFAEPSVAE